MHLESLSTRSFRALPDQRISLPETGLRLTGDNGSGKTSLLEAIAYLSSGRSNRGASDHQIARHGCTSLEVAGRVVRPHGLSTSITVRWHSGTKHVDQDGQRLPRLSEMIGLLPIVHFDIDDLTLVRAGPQARRAFIDLTLATLSRTYLQNLLDYRSTLKSRNTLLRQRNATHLDIWNLQLATVGARITQERAAFLPQLEGAAQAIYTLISQSPHTLSLQYRPSFATAAPDGALALLRTKAERDCSVGYTTIGPHRDDIAILLANRPARPFASLGQAKTIVLALLGAQTELFSIALGHPPVVLLDDLWGDLDPQRLARLSAIVPTDAQVVVTDASTARLPERFLNLHELRF